MQVTKDDGGLTGLQLHLHNAIRGMSFIRPGFRWRFHWWRERFCYTGGESWRFYRYPLGGVWD
ncbi:MAG: hypothetical protein IPN18_00945 [Ignavibacteriales bacterium]|nr:hypothetical protein [Ignavibacteriales bacterium]